MKEYQTCIECDGRGEVPVERVRIVPDEFYVTFRTHTKRPVGFIPTLADLKGSLDPLGYDVHEVTCLQCATVPVLEATAQEVGVQEPTPEPEREPTMSMECHTCAEFENLGRRDTIGRCRRHEFPVYSFHVKSCWTAPAKMEVSR